MCSGIEDENFFRFYSNLAFPRYLSQFDEYIHVNSQTRAAEQSRDGGKWTEIEEDIGTEIGNRD